jgi:hypothetical protein
MSSGKIVLGVFGALLAMFGIGLLVAGAALLWATGTQRTSDGFISSSTAEASTDSYALTSSHLDLGAVRNDWFPAGWLATVQVTASRQDDAPVFVGIGPEDDVTGYLEDVAHDEVTRISDGEVTYRSHEGNALPAMPAEQEFWVASAEGSGSQSLTWDIEAGQWTVLIMNADASPEMAVDVSAGAKTPWLTVAIVILLVGGFFCGGVGAVMLVFAFKRPASVATERAPEVTPVVATDATESEHDTA